MTVIAVQRTPVLTKLSGRRRRGRVHVELTLSWTWNHNRTRVHRIKALGAPHGVSYTIACDGRGCPKAFATTVTEPSLKLLDGLVFRAGDRLYVTVNAPALSSERFELRFRSERRPTGRAL